MITNKIFKWGFIFILLAVMAFSLAAQPGEGGGQGGGPNRERTEEDVKKRVDRMAESLDLSDDQKSSVMAHDLEAYRKAQAFRADNHGDWEAMRPYMQKLRKEREAKLTEILSDAQMAVHKEQQEERRQAREQKQEQGQGQSNSSSSENTQRDRGRGAQ